MSENKCIRTFIITAVFTLTLSHLTTGGSWKNLERKLIQEDHNSKHWDKNRIHFPDEEYSEPSWRPAVRPQDEFTRRQCLADCPVSNEHSPVCGTDDITYQNIGQLQCAIVCGVGVDLHRLSACVTVPPVTTTTTTLPPVTPTTRDQELEQCIRSCPSTPEYNPVCGTNGVTYNNIGKLECARYCGVDVELWRNLPCPSYITTTSTTAAPTPVDELQKCIDSCPATSQYDPVCGTNNVTYYNIGRLECAKACGVDVNLLRRWPCSVDVSESSSTSGSETTKTDEDYDGDIDVRYPGPKARRRFQ